MGQMSRMALEAPPGCVVLMIFAVGFTKLLQISPPQEPRLAGPICSPQFVENKERSLEYTVAGCVALHSRNENSS